MPETFLHGVEVIEINDGPRPIQTVRSAVIGLVGTAPDSEAEVKATLLTGVVGSNNALTWTSKLTGNGGNDIQLKLVDPQGNDKALSISVSGKYIEVSLATDGSGAITTTAAQLKAAIEANSEASDLLGLANTGGGGATATADVTTGAVTSVTITNGGSGFTTPPTVTFSGVGSDAAGTAVLTNGVVTGVTITAPGSGYSSAPTVSIASPGSTGAGVVAAVRRVSLSGGEDEAFPLNTPVLVTGNDVTRIGRLGDAGTLKQAMDDINDQAGAVVIVVRVDEGVDDDATLANVAGSAGSGSYTGAWAFVGAESITGFCPRILCAPGWTSQRPDNAANPVVAEMLGIANRLRAVIIADGPNTDDDDAVDYRRDWGSKRVYVVDPGVKIMNSLGEIVGQPTSARVAGLIARVDNELGFWNSPSNKIINGIVGTGREVDFTLGDTTSRANLLNENEITTIIRQDGFRLWGNRTCSDDPKWAFLSVVRTADMINDSILRAHMWAVDRNINRTYLEDVAQGVNNYLQRLKALGAILGGECFPSPGLNTPATIEAGQVYFDFLFTPNYPAERVTFRSRMVNDFVEEIL